MGSKRQMTQAKMARERDVKEKRARKLASERVAASQTSSGAPRPL